MLHFVVFVLATLNFGAVHAWYFDHEKYFPNNVVLEWSFDKDEILMRLTAPSSSWIGIGFSPQGVMAGSDIIIAGLRKGKGYILDTYATKSGPPVVDKHQDVKALEFVREDFRTSVVMRRKLKTNDPDDREIKPGKMTLIWAYGFVEEVYHKPTYLNYHFLNRGVAELELIPKYEGGRLEHTAYFKRGVKLRWGYSHKDITFEFTAPTLGWVGFGFSPGEDMVGADMIIGGWEAFKDHEYIYDTHATRNSAPKVNEKKNVELLEVEEKNLKTTIKVRRKLDTGDPDDMRITEGQMNIIWAYGGVDISSKPNGFNYHFFNRGSKKIRLIMKDIDKPTEYITQTKWAPTIKTTYYKPSTSKHYYKPTRPYIPRTMKSTRAPTTTMHYYEPKSTTTTKKYYYIPTSTTTTKKYYYIPSTTTTKKYYYMPSTTTTKKYYYIPTSTTRPPTTSKYYYTPTPKLYKPTTSTAKYYRTTTTPTTTSTTTPTPTPTTTPMPEEEEGGFANLDDKGEVQLLWTYSGNKIKLALTVHTQGWMGIGFNSVPIMAGADIIICSVKDSKNAFVLDAYANANESPKGDESQDWTISQFIENDSLTFVIIERQLRTDDPNDVEFTHLIQHPNSSSITPVRKKDLYVLWAYGSKDLYGEPNKDFYHGQNRGAKKMNDLLARRH